MIKEDNTSNLICCAFIASLLGNLLFFRKLIDLQWLLEGDIVIKKAVHVC